MNQACIIDFTGRYILKQDESCQELLKLMLVADPEKRPSALECLKHGYFKEVIDGDKHVQKLFMLYG